MLAMGGLIAHAKNRNGRPAPAHARSLPRTFSEPSRKPTLGDPAGPLRLWPGGIAQATTPPRHFLDTSGVDVMTLPRRFLDTS